MLSKGTNPWVNSKAAPLIKWDSFLGKRYYKKFTPKRPLTDKLSSWTLEKSAANLQHLVCISNTAWLSSFTLETRSMSLSTGKDMEQTQSGNFTNNFNSCKRFLADPKKVFVPNSRVGNLLTLQFETSSKKSAK